MATGVACVLGLAYYRGQWDFVNGERKRNLFMQSVQSNSRSPSVEYVSMLVFTPFGIDLPEYWHNFEIDECLAFEGIRGLCKQCMYKIQRRKKCSISMH